jgi:glucose/arabinose dehydrogenase
MSRRLPLFCVASLLVASAFAQLPADLQLVVVADGAGSFAPIGVRHAGDGSGRLFVIDVEGRIRVRPVAGTGNGTVFLDIGSGGPPPFGFGLGGEGGLLGLAFHPDYAANGRFYIYYTDASSDGVLARYTRSAANPNVADPGSVQVLLRVDADTIYHKGGDLHFGPDGYLYLSVGDGAGGITIDACRRGQTLGPADLAGNDGNHPDCPADGNFTGSGGSPNARALQAKILRIDVDASTPAGSNELCGAGSNGAAAYAIPAGNPFAGGAGGAGRCDEIWAYGLRNPYRFSFDRATGDMFIADVGESEMEEINRRAAGSAGAANYGWPLCEGTLGNCPGTVAPILTYTHQDNGPVCSSVSGGFRYRGIIPGLRGRYVFADYCSGRMFFGSESAGSWSVPDIWPQGPQLAFAGFGEDEAGELYVADITGRLLRFQSASAEQIFRSGFE